MSEERDSARGDTRAARVVLKGLSLILATGVALHLRSKFAVMFAELDLEVPAATRFVLSMPSSVFVMLGAGLGIALLSNLLKFLLAKFPAPSHGALLGLLVGSVAILWPFQEPVNPELAVKSTRKATVMVLADQPPDEIRARHGEDFDDARLAELEGRYRGKSPSELKAMGDELAYFTPRPSQVGISLLLVVAGFVLTRLLGGRET